MRKGSTSFGACEVRCWRWLFGNKMPVSLRLRVMASEEAPPEEERESAVQGYLAYKKPPPRRNLQ